MSNGEIIWAIKLKFQYKTYFDMLKLNCKEAVKTVCGISMWFDYINVSATSKSIFG